MISSSSENGSALSDQRGRLGWWVGVVHDLRVSCRPGAGAGGCQGPSPAPASPAPPGAARRGQRSRGAGACAPDGTGAVVLWRGLVGRCGTGGEVGSVRVGIGVGAAGVQLEIGALPVVGDVDQEPIPERYIAHAKALDGHEVGQGEGDSVGGGPAAPVAAARAPVLDRAAVRRLGPSDRHRPVDAHPCVRSTCADLRRRGSYPWPPS